MLRRRLLLVPTTTVAFAVAGRVIHSQWQASKQQQFRYAHTTPITHFSAAHQHHHHSNSTTTDSRSCEPLIGIKAATNMPAYLLELCYRSSYAREKLRERIMEPSVEVALRELSDYTRLRKAYTIEEMEALLAADDVTKIDLLLDHFQEWYYQLRAPEKVKMHEPWTWFPKARQMRRKFIFHAGPTNSGKTHAALEQLMRAKSGVYCAPLKALAAQVWHKVDAKVPCDLLIGDERQFGGSAEHVSCTMEMTPVDYAVDVGVIDEVQMLSDRERGWAWTRAIIGLPAKEIHLCGEERALEAVKKLLWQTKELNQLTVVHHKRLVGLHLSPSLSGDYRHVQNGDCVVAFGRKKIFEIKSEIENSHPNAVVNVIYGGLPFTVRESESEQFNEGVAKHVAYNKAQQQQRDRNTASSPPPPPHVLVTTDAIAYGLNMNIRRIIFSTMRKFDGHGMIDLPQSTVLQVGGRAGRFGMVFADDGGEKKQNTSSSSTSSSSSSSAAGGLVTTLFPNDLRKVEAAFASPLPMIPKAGLLPTADILALFAEMTYGNSNKKGRGGGKSTAGTTNSTADDGDNHTSISFGRLMADFSASMSQQQHQGEGHTHHRHHNHHSSSSSPYDTLFFPCDMTRSVVKMADALDAVGSARYISGSSYSTSTSSSSSNAASSTYTTYTTYSSATNATTTAATTTEANDQANLPFPIRDRIIFCFCPLSESGDSRSYELLKQYAADHCRGGPVPIRLDGMLAKVEATMRARTTSAADDSNTTNSTEDDNDTNTNNSRSATTNSLQWVHDNLSELEWIYRMAEVYGWLSWRFGRTFVVGSTSGGNMSTNTRSDAFDDDVTGLNTSSPSPPMLNAQECKDLCSHLIRQHLTLLPRTHVPPFYAKRVTNANHQQRQFNNNTNNRHHNRANNNNNNNYSNTAAIDFEPRPLVDLRPQQRGSDDNNDHSADHYSEGGDSGSVRRHHHHRGVGIGNAHHHNNGGGRNHHQYDNTNNRRPSASNINNSDDGDDAVFQRRSNHQQQHSDTQQHNRQQYHRQHRNHHQGGHHNHQQSDGDDGGFTNNTSRRHHGSSHQHHRSNNNTSSSGRNNVHHHRNHANSTTNSSARNNDLEEF